MSRLIESIRVYNGKVSNLALHASRMRAVCSDFLKMEKNWDLESLLSQQKVPTPGLYKCRVLYDEKNTSVEFVSYQVRPVRSLMIVNDDSISYEYKFANRTAIDSLFARRGSCDDILIVKNGLITDASHANVIFKDHGTWITPKHCLLKGTMRQSMLDAGRITERDIRVSDVAAFSACKLINAMILDQMPEMPVSAILYK